MRKALKIGGLIVWCVGGCLCLVPGISSAQLTSDNGLNLEGHITVVAGSASSNQYGVSASGNGSRHTTLNANGFTLDSTVIIGTTSASTSTGSNSGGSGTTSGGSSGSTSGGGGGPISGGGFSFSGSVLGTSTESSSSAVRSSYGRACTAMTEYEPKTTITRTGKNSSVDIKRLQRFLTVFEGANLAVDGVYKKADIQAVIAFQERHAADILTPQHLSRGTGAIVVRSLAYIAGIVKHACANTLVKSGSTKCPVFSSTLRLGDSGVPVDTLQQFLTKEVGANFTNHGVFDTATGLAVQQFQKKYSSNILTPAGLTAPSGKWLSLSIKKANQLSGCN